MMEMKVWNEARKNVRPVLLDDNEIELTAHLGGKNDCISELIFRWHYYTRILDEIFCAC